MTPPLSQSSRAVAPAWLVALVASVFTALPASALYKVVGADGKVTYTDRPAVGVENKVQPLNVRGNAGNDVALPIELRQVAQRYPVTLYTTADCTPCDTGRQLLRTRGIPFSERTVATPDDGSALERITGSRALPSLTIGSQIVRGLQTDTWASYLDAAGYPKESRLPANFPETKAVPLTETREAPAAPAAAPAPAPRRAAPAPAPQEPASRIRF